MKFNLETAIQKAEAGDSALWEDIARYLLAKQVKPKAKKSAKASGPQTWAHVTLADGREFLTSAYARATHDATLSAHGETAQYRARMEDSGDRGESTWHPQNQRSAVFLDPTVRAVPVRKVVILNDNDAIELTREHCFTQRINRFGLNIAYRETA